jgi:hypothetical protein
MPEGQMAISEIHHNPAESIASFYLYVNSINGWLPAAGGGRQRGARQLPVGAMGTRATAW